MTTASGILRGPNRGGACDWELLSAYADGVLDAAVRRRVEEHLGECPACRADLDGLRRVVGHLGRLERRAPPPVLADRVARRVEVAAPRPGLLGRVEEALRRLPVESATLLTFGVIVALAAIAALFVAGVEDAGRTLRLGAEVVEGGGDGPELRVRTALIGDRTFDRRGAEWWERGLPGELVGRSGERGGDEGIVEVGPDAPAARDLLEAEPRLRDLLSGADAVVARAPDGAVLRIRAR